jgi:hypothetical protein
MKKAFTTCSNAAMLIVEAYNNVHCSPYMHALARNVPLMHSLKLYSHSSVFS